jgi:dGTP triphosphohydrolase
MNLPIFEKRELVKSKVGEKTKYVEHFIVFFNEHYKDESSNTDFYQSFLENVKKSNIPTWDNNILRKFRKNPTAQQLQLFSHLIAVIDFIAGLTDRYCLEIFDEVYHEFVLT